MTFLNWSILAGIAAIAIPVLIHLLSRRTPRHVNWAAMIFLVESLRTRSRTIILEELILMSLRCLLIAALVLAAARPFIPVSSNIPWMIVLPALLLCGFTAGACGVSWKNKKHRLSWVWTTLTLLLIALGATIIEHVAQKTKWSSKGLKDIAIIIDASGSMLIKDSSNISSFEKAVRNASKMVEKCKGSDAVSIILAGPAPQNIIENPISDKGEILAALENSKPLGGSMDIHKAILTACENLEHGTNPAKRIAVFTDAQKLRWDTASGEKWNQISSAMGRLESAPKIICSTIPVDVDGFTNLSITQIQPSNPITAVKHPQRFNIRILNTSQNEVPPAAVRFEVNGTELPPLMTSTIAPQQSETLSFDYTFTDPGIYTVTARIDNSDSLAADNVMHRVIKVMGNVEVLIIDGGPDSGAMFIELALCPLRQSSGDYLVTPSVVSPVKFQSMNDLGRYQAIIMADVANLPFESASRIDRYASDGGGLLVILGQNSKKVFYNSWADRFGKTLMPAAMGEWKVKPENPAKPSAQSFDKSILSALSGEDTPAVNRVIVRAWWTLEMDNDDLQAASAASFDDNSPMLVKREYGKGTIMACAFSFDPLDSTFARHGESFVPFINQIVQHLANPQTSAMNMETTQPVLLTFKTKPDTSPSAPEKLAVITPQETTEFARLSVGSQSVNISFDKTDAPGLYKINLPGQIAADIDENFPENILPLNITGDPRESTFEPLTDSDFKSISEYVEIFQADDPDQITAAMIGEIPGREIWRVLALMAFVLIIAETFMTRLAVR